MKHFDKHLYQEDKHTHPAHSYLVLFIMAAQSVVAFNVISINYLDWCT